MTVDHVTTVLGESRLVTRVYGDGSVDCPFCTSPIVYPAIQCLNPWCDAYPAWSPEGLTKRLADRAIETKRRADDKARAESVARMAKERHAEHEQWEQAQMIEARRRGACLRCLFQSGWERAKFVRHRGPCPKETT